VKREWILLVCVAALQTNVHALSALSAQAIEQATNSRVLSAEGVKAANAAIGTSELIEENEKVVNEIYLSTLAKDIDVFTMGQADQLFVLANQCPLIGGNAVYRARALYSLINDDQEFDDPALCLAQGITIRSLEQPPAWSSALIVPNPANDRASLIYDPGGAADAVLVLYDALGREALRVPLPPKELMFEFSIATKAPGAYHFVVESEGGSLGEGRFVVIH
jgi:hypothetical protein